MTEPAVTSQSNLSAGPPRVPVVFGTAIEALVERALRHRMTPAIEQALSRAGIDLQRLSVAYAYPTFARLLELLPGAVYPELSTAAALERLGADYLFGLEKTLVGKGLFALARLRGPRAMLERMTRNVRTANNYMDSRVEPRGDGTFAFHYAVLEALLPAMQPHPPPPPEYFLGILRASLEAVGAKGIEVTLERYDLPARHAVYRVKYDP